LSTLFLFTEKETHGTVTGGFVSKARGFVSKAKGSKIRVKLFGYDHTLVESVAQKIIAIVTQNGGVISGPVPLPTRKEIITVIRSPHKYKDSREQFELRTHKRLIDIYNSSAKLIEALTKLEMPAGVEIQIKL